MTGSQTFTVLEERLLDIFLTLARHKSEVVPACTSVQNFSPHHFEGFCMGAGLQYQVAGRCHWLTALVRVLAEAACHQGS